MKRIGILNGPNLNRLGSREQKIYGTTTVKQLTAILNKQAKDLNLTLDHFQSNSEGELIDKLYIWSDAFFAGVVFNPGAYTHTSIALRDAIISSTLKIIEVHISNIFIREPFRNSSIITNGCYGLVVGLGLSSYSTALEFLAKA